MFVIVSDASAFLEKYFLILLIHFFSCLRRNDIDYDSGEDWQTGNFFSGEDNDDISSVEENLVQ